MPQATLPLLMNAMVASMFIMTFLVIAWLNPSARGSRWFALSYGVGVLEPLLRLSVVAGADQAVVQILAPCVFLIGLTLMSPAMSLFHGRRPRWGLCAAIVLPGIAYYVFRSRMPSGWFWYEGVYHGFFAASMVLCGVTTLLDAPRTAMHRALAMVFFFAGLQFLSKTVIAYRFDTSLIDQNYAGSLYAVFSQTSAGVLLVAAGLLILISVLQSVVQTHHDQARIDPLTGLPNRRALHEAYEKRDLAGASVVLIDIDHFKAVNDRLGHDRGDAVLRAVSDCLDRTRPANALLARIGGEEFALLLPNSVGETARLICEGMRLSVADLALPDLPMVTISLGVAPMRPGEDLADALRRADRPLYEAKRTGRNRCVVADAEERRPRLTLVEAVAP
ncbi:GGDEF domain-containing protein [Sphingomonadaceae bacterium jetA1]|jgi:diguanylate cyclase (GGDEF)-like protein|uniref:GGDEF domain-containing protein n=1 Tax=Facivitalis istanbulensis TaxID=3075838 RepID=UPI003478F850